MLLHCPSELGGHVRIECSFLSFFLFLSSLTCLPRLPLSSLSLSSAQNDMKGGNATKYVDSLIMGPHSANYANWTMYCTILALCIVHLFSENNII